MRPISSKYNPRTEGKKTLPLLTAGLLTAVIAGTVVYSLPMMLAYSVQRDQEATRQAFIAEFPVTVDPIRKIIVENFDVNSYLASPDSPLQAAAASNTTLFKKIFVWLAKSIGNAPWYQSISAVEGTFVTITPGMRKEQVTGVFADAFDWTKAQKTQFTTPDPASGLPLAEGSFAPGIYFLPSLADPQDAQDLINKKFENDVLSHYSTTTRKAVPLEQALIIASLIERETMETEDMRLISGIIWNRIFINMKLQVDATLQYAKASSPSVKTWWPKVVPNDKYIKSPYNTYQHEGLPPTPIATPSVAAIVAALNPIKTSCLFYFNDDEGTFHCTETYEDHVALLKQFFGQGK